MIDWNFIAELEGSELTGYVPDPEISQSGVTIATGVDLGQMAESELVALPKALAAKLRPYLGLRRGEALAAIRKKPLRITETEALALNEQAQKRILYPLRVRFLRDSGVSFDDQRDRFKTVVASVTYQYGAPWARTPNFWRSVVARDEGLMIGHLRNFRDKYPTRRNKEADYLSVREPPRRR